jgi:hypothetical protein
MSAAMTKEPDLIESICEGKGRRFHGEACEFYTFWEKICALLKQHKLEEFWDEGRCAYIILQIIEEACMKTLQELYDGLPLDDAVDYDMQAVIGRLRHLELESGFNLAVWHRYVYTTVYREIRKQLPFLPDKKHCGTCKHISRSSAYVCLDRNEIRDDLDYVCEKYRLKNSLSEVPERESCASCENLSRKSFYCYRRSEKRKKTDATCEFYSQNISADFVSLNDEPMSGNDGPNTQFADRLFYEIECVNEEHSDSPEAQLASRDELFFIRNVLQERIDTAAIGSKKREMYERQYQIFFSFVLKLSDDIPEEDALKDVAEESHLKTWTVKRDIKDVREFLKNVLEGENHVS